MFTENNLRTKLRTWLKNRRNIKNTEPRSKFTGSYKKKECKREVSFRLSSMFFPKVDFYINSIPHSFTIFSKKYEPNKVSFIH